MRLTARPHRTIAGRSGRVPPPFALSIRRRFTDHRDEGVYVGLWVPSILAAGAFWMAATGRRA